MKILFGVIGAVLGGLIGDLFGALVGMGAGIAVAVMLGRSDSKAAAATPRDPVRPAPAFVPLETRMARLEQEVAALRQEVRRLPGAEAPTPAATGATPSATGATPSATDAAPAATPGTAPMPASAPQPSRIVEAEPQVLEVTLPPRTVEPEAPAPIPVPAVASVPSFEDTLPPGPERDAQAGPPATPLPPAEPPAAAPAPVPRPRPAPAPSPTLQERMPPWLRKWVFGGNTIVKVGVLVLFLGLAFLLRYAAERVTVPVELRYAGVALFGAVLLVLGWRLRDRRDAAGGTGYGLILQGAGIGIFYLTTLAALKLNQLLPPEAAFGFLFAVAVLSAVLAVAQNAPWLAIVAAAEGFAAPVLVSTGGGNHIALFSYLAILDVGIFLVAWFRAWRALNLIGAVGTFTLAAAWARAHYTDPLYASTQGFLLLFFVLFTAVGVLFARRALAQGDEPAVDDPLSQRAAQALARVGRVDSALVFGVPLASFGLQYLLVRDMAFGPAWAALGFSLYYLLLGGLLMRNASARYALLGEAHVIVSVIFGTLAIPLALEGSWTGATWAVEAAGMYWLGLRQRRTYSRAFALAVLAAATWQVGHSFGIDLTPGTPLLAGSVLGLVLLGASALAMFRLGRQLTAPAAWERAGHAAQLWIAAAAGAAIAWTLLTPTWAAAATALLALACAGVDARTRLPALQWAATALHGVALVGFAGTLHVLDGEAMLSSGWSGVAAALVIGGSLLATAWLSLQPVLRAARERRAPPAWSLGSSLGLLAGVAVLSLSLLFVMPAEQAARAWPWMGVVALWLGLRLFHPALALAWAALQVGAGVALLAFGEPLWAEERGSLAVWGPLMLTLAALLSGDALQRAARTATAPGWLKTPALHWAVVAWSLLWWVHVLLPDAIRHLRSIDRQWLLLLPALLAGWVTLSSVLATLLARWRGWHVLGQATWATLGGWIASALLGVGLVGFAPHEHAGWAAWPVAAAWHLVLLKMQERWGSKPALRPLHVAGFWLFLLLAARELQWWGTGWGEPGSAWPALGWVVVPALVLAGLTRPGLQRRWPLSAFGRDYLLIGCTPVALYLGLWLWVTNTQSGAAAPLPYVPLLNPLEIGHGLVLLALVIWHRALPADMTARLPRPLVHGVLGATAFALYTGIVLRTCHHWAGVAWSEDALFDSTLTQAALSVAWSVVGVALMMLGHRRVRRAVWVVGAALLGVVVLKLFFVELADRGGLYRIVSFIVVGLLLLVVGYFAPVPPSREAGAESPR